jgi:RNA polymerase subunit RPABC4/transcription elongation factor Spt4
MALVKCKECGEKVSTKAKTCPNCGAKAPKKTSLFTWLVLLMIVVIVYAVNQTPSNYNASSTKQTATPLSKATTSSTSVSSSEPKKPKSAWSYHQSKDEMSGKVTGYITSYSRNTLNGWLRNGKVLLGYTCGQGFYVRANDLGFTMDDLDCDQYSCKRTHYARVKFDDGSPSDIRFSVWDDNNDGMSLQKHNAYLKRDNKSFLINSMKAGTTMYLEIELLNTKGKQQIAEFDLRGFTKAFAQCK